MGGPKPRRVWGFTLIELMVTLAVVVIFAIIAYPSFAAVRQRAALRGAGEQTLAFWNQARLEAAKRNAMVKVAIVQSASGQNFCLGAATTTDIADTTPCDCTTAGACNVASYPGDNSEWQSSTLAGVTLGGTDWPTSSALVPAIIEPKNTSLVNAATKGTITLKAPVGNRSYLLRLNVDQFGRGVLCEPTLAPDKMSDYNNRRC